MKANVTHRSSTVLASLCLAATILVATALAACGGSSQASTSASNPPAPTATGEAPPTAAVGPFTQEDLRGLVLRPVEGGAVVPALRYRPGYSGTSDLLDVRHWTLVPPERLQAAGFVDGYVTIFFTDAFLSDFGRSGRSLLTAALLFEKREGAVQALKVFADSRDELWEECRPLSSALGAHSIAQTGRQGTDNTSDICPTTSIGMQVANVVLIVGSQGGARFGNPLGKDLLRSLAKRLLTRTQDQLAEIHLTQ